MEPSCHQHSVVEESQFNHIPFWVPPRPSLSKGAWATDKDVETQPAKDVNKTNANKKTLITA